MIFEEDGSVKLLISMGLFAEVMIFTQLPYISTKISTSKNVMMIFNCISIGIFLGIAFFHMIPESNEKLEEYFKSPLKEA